MKHNLLAITFGTVITLIACTSVQSPQLPTPTHLTSVQPIMATTQLTPAPTIQTTQTPVPPTATFVPQTPIPTNTPLQTETATSEPFTQGSILFLWDQATPPVADGSVEFEPTVNLYLAKPGTAPDEWQIEPLLIQLRAITPVYLSPDNKKLALLILEDTNNDGAYFTSDIYQIYVYSLSDGSLVQIDNPEFLVTLSLARYRTVRETFVHL